MSDPKGPSNEPGTRQARQAQPPASRLRGAEMTINVKDDTSAQDWRVRADRIGSEIAGYAAGHDAGDLFVADSFRRLKEEGFFKMHVPAELGGHGASYAELA